MKKTFLIVISFLIISYIFADCDMMSMIARYGHNLSEDGITTGSYQYPLDYVEFLMTRSTDSGSKKNENGYGIIYYPKGVNELYYSPTVSNLSNNCWYLVDEDLDGDDYYHGTSFTIGYGDNLPLNYAYSKIFNQNGFTGNEATIVMGHARNANGGEGSHPFRFDWDGITYTFVHNGGLENTASATKHNIKRLLFNELDDADWFETYESNWEGTSSDYTTWIDSEILFHWIMKNIIDNGGAVITGIYKALTADLVDTDPPYWSNASVDLEDIFEDPYFDDDINSNWINCVNFMLSDGNAIYAFKNGEDAKHTIFYRDDLTDFYALNSYTNPSAGNSIEMDKYDFAYFPEHGDCFEIDDFISGSNPITTPFSTISTNSNWSGILFIEDDINVTSGATLNIQDDCIVEFGAESTFTIVNGTVNLEDNAEIRLANASEIIIDGTSSIMNLEWGSQISGCTAGYYEDRVYYHGDRIVAQNGGLIKTGDDTNPGVEVIICSFNGEKWDGIAIDDPANNDVFWFVNCDISNIYSLWIRRTSENTDVAELKIIDSEIYDCAELLVRDDHILTVDNCEIFNNTTGINVYDAEFYISDSEIFENTTGININYVADQSSEITDCEIYDNNSGFINRDGEFDFSYNDIYDNNYDGVYVYSAGTFTLFDHNQVYNNGYSEYVGYEASYLDGRNGSNIFSDTSSSGGSDLYLLRALGWQLGDDQILFGGNTVSIADTTRFYPYYCTFDFEIGREFLIEIYTTAREDMTAGYYSTAASTFEFIIDEYPESNEAVASIRNLYFIERYTNRDFTRLIQYYESLNIAQDHKLYRAIRDMTIKSYMQNEEYETAIQLLEPIISNPVNNTEFVDALIDEAYSYLKLYQSGSRMCPEYSTVKPTNQREFQEIVNNLYDREDTEDPINNDVTYAKVKISNYPNPFNPITTIDFSIEQDCKIELSVYNVKGQLVKTLIKDFLEEGSHSVQWNGTDSSNKSVSSGVYFYKVSNGKSSTMKKMLLLK